MATIFFLDGEDLVKKINCLLRYSSYHVIRDDQFSISVDWNTSSAKKDILLHWNFGPNEAELDEDEGIIFESRWYLLQQLKDFLYPEFWLINETVSDDLSTVDAKIVNYVKRIFKQPSESNQG